jgi:hypothetical protein
MNIGLNLWTAAPGIWWPDGASYAADFAADRYMRDGEAVAAGAAYGVARASSRYAADGGGSFVAFGPDVAARTDCGLSVEPASSNILTDPVGLDAWGAITVSATPLAGPILGIFDTPMLVADTTGSAVARLRHPITPPVTNGMLYALTYWVQAGNTSTMVAIAGGDGGRSRLTIALDTGTAAGLTQGRGPMALTEVVRYGTDIYCVKALWTPSFTGACEVAIGPGTGVMGDTIIALGAFAEPGSAFTSPMIGDGIASSRDADSLTLHLPAGTHELTFTFDDLTTQVIEGAGGDYAVPALARSTIRSVLAVAA